MDEEQVRRRDLAQREVVVEQILRPLKGVPFNLVIEAMTGFRVLSFDADDGEHRALLDLLTRAAARAGEAMNREGIASRRVNEVGNRIEPFVVRAINALGVPAQTPKAASGKKKAAGYPDIEVNFGSLCCHLECKSYNASNIATTKRSFYFSPSQESKVTQDALHPLLAYEMRPTDERREGKTVYYALRFKLLAIDSLSLDLEHEFNSNNRRLYAGKESCRILAGQTIG